MVSRLIDTLACIAKPIVSASIWNELPAPAVLGKRQLPGLVLSNARLRAVVDSGVELCCEPSGFTTEQLREKVLARLSLNPHQYSTSSAAYDLAKLRAKGLVRRIPRRFRYDAPPTGLRAITALVVILDNVIPPVLADAAKSANTGRKKTVVSLDNHYRDLQRNMQQLFSTLGIAA